MEGVWGREYTAPAAGVWLQIKVTSWGHYLSSTAAKVCRYYTCCLHIIALGWEPHTHTHSDTHTTGCTNTREQNKHKQHGSQAGPHSKFIHTFSPAKSWRDTLCAIPRLTELKQMKELVNEIWLNSLKCNTAAARGIGRTKNDNVSQSCHGNKQKEHPNKGCYLFFFKISFFLRELPRVAPARMWARQCFSSGVENWFECKAHTIIFPILERRQSIRHSSQVKSTVQKKNNTGAACEVSSQARCSHLLSIRL